MRTLLLSAVSAAGLLLSSAAFADDAKPMTPTPVSADNSDKLICHAISHEGSVVHRSECRTQKEWDRIRFESQQSLLEWQQRNLTQMGR
jgi:hypothetical protein